MLKVSKLSILPFMLVLIGAGCVSSAPGNDLPATPSTMMKDKSAVEPEGGMMGSSMPQKDSLVMEEKNGALMSEDEKKTTGENGVGMEEESAMMKKADLKPYYASYSAEQSAKALKEGRAVVYYFWAGWCPICQAEEPKIKSWIEESDLPIAGFRVNYDTETTLKTTYKIPYQHTIVFLNAKGEEAVRFNGPVGKADFLAALEKAAR